MSKVYIANQIVMQDSSLQSLKLTRKIISLIKANDFEVIHTDCMLGKWNLLLYILFGKNGVNCS